MDEGDILVELVKEDFGISGNGRWYRSDEHSSLVVDKIKGVYYFNSKSFAGGALDYLINVRKMPFTEAKSYLKSRGFTDTVVLTINPNDKEDTIVYPKLAEAFHSNSLDQQDITRQYWYTRGLTDSTIDRFQLGYYNGWYTIPIFFGGVLRQIQMRRDLPKKEVKRWYKETPPLLFNSDLLRIVDKVFIVEGPNDVLAMMQNNIPAVCCDTGAESWLDGWYSLFLRCKEIIVSFDADQAGDNGSKMVAKKLGEYRCKIYNFWGFDRGYSPAYFFRDGGTTDDLMELVNKKGKYLMEFGNDETKGNKSRKFSG